MAAPGILGRILDEKRREVDARSGSLTRLIEQSVGAPPPRDLAGALRRGHGDRPKVIAEFKRASPSAGPIRPGADARDIAVEYQAAGAAAISVLTDGSFFDGSLDHLAAARAAVAVPCLRKDFLIDVLQVYEARAAGADGLLLIVAALDDDRLAGLLGKTRELGMTALVEVHDAREAERAVAAGADVIGVNHRDLATFAIDRGLFARIKPLLPEGRVTVAESGIRDAADVRALAEAGADAILVGESLMRKPSPGQALRELLA